MNVLVACWRGGRDSQLVSRLEAGLSQLIPSVDGKCVKAAADDDGLVMLVQDATGAGSIKGQGAVLGLTSATDGDWWKVGGPDLSTAHAAFRTSPDAIELVTDVLGSRSMWHVQTDELFAASTAIRPLIALLGSYEPEVNARLWMLTSGTIGPEQSWDRRIKPVPGDSRLLFSRNDWSSVLKTAQPAPTVVDCLPDEREKGLDDCMAETIGGLVFDESEWAMSLSGGIDSRAILAKLSRRQGIRSITWGESNTDGGDTDARVAARLAAQFKSSHEFLTVKPDGAVMDQALDTFIRASEGRVDYFSGYVDGMEMWGRLRGLGINGLIRGDHVFGWRAFATDFGLRSAVGATILDDISLPETVGAAMRAGWPGKQWPETLERSADESVATWRDNVYSSYRIPVVQAALTQVKSGYVDIANPIIARPLVNMARGLPDEFKVDRALFKKVAMKSTPGIGLASDGSLRTIGEVVRIPELVDITKNSLDDSNLENLVPVELIKYVSNGLNRERTRGPRRRSDILRRFVRAYVPMRWRRARALRSSSQPVDFYRLAFRLHLINRMDKIFKEDAKFFQ